MKPRATGYTLIELLVVMAIILILAGAGFATFRFVMERMRATEALAAATAINAAVDSFLNDHQNQPCDLTGDTTIDLNSPEGLTLLRVLLNEEEDSSGTARNTKGHAYLSLKLTTSRRGGLLYDPSGKTLIALYDPWGGSYQIRLDGDSDEQIEIQPKAAASPRLLKRRHAVVWSDGGDGVKGTGTVKDDVGTW